MIFDEAVTVTNNQQSAGNHDPQVCMHIGNKIFNN
jgi:hypothetical protein